VTGSVPTLAGSGIVPEKAYGFSVSLQQSLPTLSMVFVKSFASILVYSLSINDTSYSNALPILWTVGRSWTLI
jgi:hypothetical protein